MLRVVTIGALEGVALDRDLLDVVEATTARAGLASLEGADVVVVADAEPLAVERLLELLRTDHPHVVRIAQLPVDPAAGIDHVALAHLVVEQPTTTAELEEAILQAATLRGALDPTLAAGFLARYDGLPGIPVVWAELAAAVADPDVSVDRVADLIAQDAALAAAVLRLANSATFASPVRASTISDAVMRPHRGEAEAPSAAAPSPAPPEPASRWRR